MKGIQKRTHIIRKYIFALAAILILAGTQLGWMYHEDTAYITIQVQEGDTLWQLASAAADTDTDIRHTVHAMIETNHLAGNEDIYPGQVLQIPVKETYLKQAKQNLQSHIYP